MASVPHASKCSNYSLRSQRDLKELNKRIQECGDNFQRTQSKDGWISWICKHDKEFQMMLSEIISDGTHDPQNMDFPLQPLEEESDPNSPYYDDFAYI